MFLKHTKWALLWAVLIFILCMIPGRDLPKISWLELLQFDKAVHAGLFFVLAALLARGLGLQHSSRMLQRFPRLFSLTFCVIYGAALEWLQGALFVERTADPYDFIANATGAVAGMALFGWLNEKILAKFIR
ncbi:MAG: VanZ family protein [Bacteroidota bacterium]